MQPLYKQCVAELLGTFLLTFVGAGAVCVDSFLIFSGKPGIGLLGIATAYAIGLAIAISATMNVSGGFCNPAVTFALWFSARLGSRQAIGYILSQFVGALIAGFFLTMIFGYAGNTVSSVALGTPHSAENMKAFFHRDMDIQLTALATLIELLITFLLTFAIFGTAIDRRAPRIGGLGVGLATLAIILVASPFTGACMNPARYVGTVVWEAGILSNWSRMGDWYIYFVGPLLGAVMAAWIYASYILEDAPTPDDAGHSLK